MFLLSSRLLIVSVSAVNEYWIKQEYVYKSIHARCKFIYLVAQLLEKDTGLHVHSVWQFSRSGRSSSTKPLSSLLLLCNWSPHIKTNSFSDVFYIYALFFLSVPIVTLGTRCSTPLKSLFAEYRCMALTVINAATAVLITQDTESTNSVYQCWVRIQSPICGLTRKQHSVSHSARMGTTVYVSTSLSFITQKCARAAWY